MLTAFEVRYASRVVVAWVQKVASARLAGVDYMDFVDSRSHLHKISVQRYEKKINYTNIF